MPGRRWRLSTLVAAAAVLVGVAGCSGTGQTGQSVDNSLKGNGVTGAQFKYWSPGQRQVVADVSGPTVQGGRLSLASYRGKWVVVNFWNSTCAPCHLEEPSFESLAKTLAPQGVRFVGIDEQGDNVPQAQSFEREFEVTYPSLFDQEDSYVLDFPGAVPSTTPFTVVIDPQGKIAARAVDSMDYTTLRAFIARARSLTA